MCAAIKSSPNGPFSRVSTHASSPIVNVALKLDLKDTSNPILVQHTINRAKLAAIAVESHIINPLRPCPFSLTDPATSFLPEYTRREAVKNDSTPTQGPLVDHRQNAAVGSLKRRRTEKGRVKYHKGIKYDESDKGVKDIVNTRKSRMSTSPTNSARSAIRLPDR